jgi:ATP-dependent DNA helicase RecG
LSYLLAVKAARGDKQKGIVFRISEEEKNTFIQGLPFALTQAQKEAIQSIRTDLLSGTAMNRLVQGDVGSGKTVVALDAAYQCALSGYQSALMAPTEMLAHQHKKTAEKLLSPLDIRCGLLLGSMKAAQKREAMEKILSGEWQLVIGTHALISSNVQYKQLGLVITDEQHRFGVRQRKDLENKADTLAPHTLVLSATPIPRTVALVLYDDLDISIIDSMPAGRLPVITRIVPDDKRQSMYQYIREQALLGNQAYIVCPRLDDGQDDATSVKELYDELSEGALKGISLGIAYGSQKPDEKIKTLTDFASGKTSVLIATTVVEVGIDVSNATIMVIEDADRFGLSQLHQLRGRVGRGRKQSWCFLLGKPNERLNAMVESNDGFFIAQKDFEMRGPGDLLGSRQSGFGDIVTQGYDIRLIEQAKECTELLAQSKSYQDSYSILTRQAVEQYQSVIETTAFN